MFISLSLLAVIYATKENWEEYCAWNQRKEFWVKLECITKIVQGKEALTAKNHHFMSIFSVWHWILCHGLKAINSIKAIKSNISSRLSHCLPWWRVAWIHMWHSKQWINKQTKIPIMNSHWENFEGAIMYSSNVSLKSLWK